LVGLQPDLILVPGSTVVAAAFQRETRTIPIVFTGLADPIASGLVARFDRPSGNITGFADWEATLGGKWLALLSEIAPGLKRAAVMFNPDNVQFFNSDNAPGESIFRSSLQTAARSLKVELIPAPVHSDVERPCWRLPR
jgi:putative ABC transport system substrate-binding protein